MFSLATAEEIRLEQAAAQRGCGGGGAAHHQGVGEVPLAVDAVVLGDEGDDRRDRAHLRTGGGGVRGVAVS